MNVGKYGERKLDAGEVDGPEIARRKKGRLSVTRGGRGSSQQQTTAEREEPLGAPH